MFVILNQVFEKRCLVFSRSTFHFILVSHVLTAACGCWCLTDRAGPGEELQSWLMLESGTGKVRTVLKGENPQRANSLPSEGLVQAMSVNGFQLHGSFSATHPPRFIFQLCELLHQI